MDADPESMVDARRSQSIATAMRFLTRLGAGALDDDDVSPDFEAWSISSGTITRHAYLARMPVFAAIFRSPLVFSVSDMVIEGPKIALRARSEGMLFNGAIYSNDYMFLMELDLHGKVRRFHEYYDRRPAEEILYPARRDWVENHGGASPEPGLRS